MLGIPYTGSDPLALAVALDKDMTRRVVESSGVRVPKGFTFAMPPGDYDGDYAEFPAMLEASGLPLPVIAKPVCEGSSKGVRGRCVITAAEDLGPTLVRLWRDYRQPVLVEEFIAGEEVTTGVIGNDPPHVLGTMRVVPKQKTEHFVYSLEVKREWERHVDYEAPAKLPLAVTRELEAEALAAYTVLGCRDLARLDFRIRDGVPYFIEVNPLPGLNPESGDLVFLAYRLGLTYPQLIETVFAAAVTRCGLG
jgi:D-alanine-D-alanine ligase